jgi:UDP-N-acetylglucosamine--N-acetylmuramyl-(pentapeptide) pyrophosphoryl-undecaprenol N-acetylglucosamine transferase
MKQYRFVISGGGTGGHIFPALSIANALKEEFDNPEILFVGAIGRMEMERVPAAGYKIVGLPVRGFDRKNLFKNVKVLFDLLISMIKARNVIRQFKPHIVIGVGGYASGPTLRVASLLGIPTLIQEQNSYAGVTNKLLAKNASKVCVAYDGMERFFPSDKIVITGNPVRQDLLHLPPKAHEAYEFFGFEKGLKTVLIVGGSLGARTINESIIAQLQLLSSLPIQIIWQTGKFYIEEAKLAARDFVSSRLIVTDFVSRMDYAYSIADLVVSRAGASSISELCLLAKPVILIPSPNVAEDHQTKNALALVEKNAALMIEDISAKSKLVFSVAELIQDDKRLRELSQNIVLLAQENSAKRIVAEVTKIVTVSK